MKGKKQLLTPDEVAEMLRIARKTVVVMVSSITQNRP